ncbi:MAG: hypothetical protein ACRDBG_08300 [Waterburya sp.]
MSKRNKKADPRTNHYHLWLDDEERRRAIVLANYRKKTVQEILRDLLNRDYEDWELRRKYEQESN